MIAVDASGDVIAAGNHSGTFTGAIVKLSGSTGAGPAGVFLVAKHTAATGAPLWTYQASFPGLTDGFVFAVAVSTSADVAASGRINDATTSSTTLEATVMKLAGGSGDELWRHVFDEPDPRRHTSTSGARLKLAIGDSGLFVVGERDSALPNFAISLLAAKLDAGSGAEVWRQEVRSGSTRARPCAIRTWRGI